MTVAACTDVDVTTLVVIKEVDFCVRVRVVVGVLVIVAFEE